MRIEPRTAWNARPPKSAAKIAPTPRLWLHHSVTGTGPVPGVIKSIQDYHMGSRGWQDIGYSFLATVDGRAWTGRGALVAGGHSATKARPRENVESHAVCAIGDFDATRPPAALIEGLAQLAAHGHREGWWTCRGYTGGHRDVPGAATACPGRHLYAAIPAINRRVEQLLDGTASTKPAPSPSKPAPTPTGGLTMSEAKRLDKRIDTMRNATLLLIEAANKRIDTLRNATRLIVTAEGNEREKAIAQLEAAVDELETELDALRDA